MSLNFDLTEVKKRLGDERFEELTTSLIEGEGGKAMWHAVTNSIIWMTMTVGLGSITEDNIDEWSFRTAVVQAVYGPELEFDDGREVKLTRRDIADHVGLRTNVTNEKRSAWLKRFFENIHDRMKLDSGEPQEGLAISAFEQVNLIHREYLAEREKQTA